MTDLTTRLRERAAAARAEGTATALGDALHFEEAADRIAELGSAQIKGYKWADFIGEHQLRAIRTDVRHPFDSQANGVALDMDTFTMIVFEDPDDGYRSASSAPIVMAGHLYQICPIVDYLNIPVMVRLWERGDFGAAEGLEFIDRRNGAVILHLGTDNTDDYYPSFVCDWRPERVAENSP